jgi:hypothetical protein
MPLSIKASARTCACMCMRARVHACACAWLQSACAHPSVARRGKVAGLPRQGTRRPLTLSPSLPSSLSLSLSHSLSLSLSLSNTHTPSLRAEARGLPRLRGRGTLQGPLRRGERSSCGVCAGATARRLSTVYTTGPAAAWGAFVLRSVCRRYGEKALDGVHNRARCGVGRVQHVGRVSTAAAWGASNAWGASLQLRRGARLYSCGVGRVLFSVRAIAVYGAFCTAKRCRHSARRLLYSETVLSQCTAPSLQRNGALTVYGAFFTAKRRSHSARRLLYSEKVLSQCKAPSLQRKGALTV